MISGLDTDCRGLIWSMHTSQYIAHHQARSLDPSCRHSCSSTAIPPFYRKVAHPALLLFPSRSSSQDLRGHKERDESREQRRRGLFLRCCCVGHVCVSGTAFCMYESLISLSILGPCDESSLCRGWSDWFRPLQVGESFRLSFGIGP